MIVDRAQHRNKEKKEREKRGKGGGKRKNTQKKSSEECGREARDKERGRGQGMGIKRETISCLIPMRYPLQEMRTFPFKGKIDRARCGFAKWKEKE